MAILLPWWCHGVSEEAQILLQVLILSSWDSGEIEVFSDLENNRHNRHPRFRPMVEANVEIAEIKVGTHIQ